MCLERDLINNEDMEVEMGGWWLGMKWVAVGGGGGGDW